MLRRIRETLKSRKGFTLVELMAVIAIIGIIAAIAIPRFSDATEEAQAAKILADLRTIDSAITMHFAANNAYPDYTADDLVTAPNAYLAALPTPPSGAYSINAANVAIWTATNNDIHTSSSAKADVKADL